MVNGLKQVLPTNTTFVLSLSFLLGCVFTSLFRFFPFTKLASLTEVPPKRSPSSALAQEKNRGKTSVSTKHLKERPLLYASPRALQRIIGKTSQHIIRFIRTLHLWMNINWQEFRIQRGMTKLFFCKVKYHSSSQEKTKKVKTNFTILIQKCSHFCRQLPFLVFSKKKEKLVCLL